MQAPIWKCKVCGLSKGVINGTCPKCGPTQTVPVNDEARRESVEGLYPK